MPTTTFSIDSLLSNCNDAFPSTGSAGYLTLLVGTLATGLSYTANATTNELTTASAHGLVTGSRLRLVGGTLPAPTVTGTDYYAIVSSTTVLRLATTLANAQAGTAIDLSDAGSGALTLTEQALTAADPLSVLVNKELSHPAWTTRSLIDNLGTATNVAGVATKPTKIITIINSGGTSMVFRHILTIESTAGTTATLGNVPVGAGFILITLDADETITAAQAAAISLSLRARNV